MNSLPHRQNINVIRSWPLTKLLWSSPAGKQQTPGLTALGMKNSSLHLPGVGGWGLLQAARLGVSVKPQTG